MYTSDKGSSEKLIIINSKKIHVIFFQTIKWKINIIDILYNHNYNKILKSDWLSTVLISALIGQCNRTVFIKPKWLDSARYHMLVFKWLFFFTASKKTLRISCVLCRKKPKISQSLLWLWLIIIIVTELCVIQFGL